uniref:Serine/threonine-protein kinase RIO2 n=1 Tax=Chromera velia CCMP2878 TaxID=1169474 RepID=A0A0G4F8L1_9ALVE|eukprot:Cvel_15652.t1-p1 / transcript=Cvel_15652.t1 / gene=Cvel_15652 / organism=Chromera_velia_CCMP2878 / gene_product=Serine/threonine-protein kinase rio2, putative / transcript_product=Serine/threonine-protein kinase rio2, putative / location=Cvel_scaffold1168:9024-12148(-) / protein_length=534 / sequence_SO=supercontig / SO=protein_coding / is_pseudo=false
MKLDAEVFRYLSKADFRVLTAVEMGHKNHEYVPTPLIESISNLRRHGIHSILSNLLKHKLLAHDRKKYDGYKLTYLGYDYLALKVLVHRGKISGVGVRMGVGKESDIHLCKDEEGRVLILKLHRLGRVSFRSVKTNRDYLQHRSNASWMYLARLAALKEFAYMRALKENGFPVPEPVDVNRHAIVMGFVDATPLVQVRSLERPFKVLEKLMHLIIRLAQSGLIHGDFNEFNLMLSDDEEVTLIDFPQIVPVSHPNAEMYFDRDVRCVATLFAKKFGIEVEEVPKFKDIVNEKEAAPPTGSAAHKERIVRNSAHAQALEFAQRMGVSAAENLLLLEAVEERRTQAEEGTADTETAAQGGEAIEEEEEGEAEGGDGEDGPSAGFADVRSSDPGPSSSSSSSAQDGKGGGEEEGEEDGEDEDPFIEREGEVPSLSSSLRPEEGEGEGEEGRGEDESSDEDEDGEEEEGEGGEGERAPRPRKDKIEHIWRPSGKKYDSSKVRERARAAVKKKESRSKGNSGKKKGDARKLRDSLKGEF